MAQGYVTAQDRLWQMDMLRRNADGELAEVLGPSLHRPRQGAARACSFATWRSASTAACPRPTAIATSNMRAA